MRFVFSICSKSVSSLNLNSGKYFKDNSFARAIKTIKELNGKLWQVRRGMRPMWWATALNINENWDHVSENHSMKVIFPEVHESEWRWVSDDSEFDAIIGNDSTLEHLKHQVLNLLV